MRKRWVGRRIEEQGAGERVRGFLRRREKLGRRTRGGGSNIGLLRRESEENTRLNRNAKLYASV